MAIPIRDRTGGDTRYPGPILLLVAWTLLGSAAYARHFLFIEGPSARPWMDLAGWLVSFYPWVLLSQPVFRLERRYPIRGFRTWKHLALFVLISLPLTWLGCKLALLLAMAAHLAWGQPVIAPPARWAILRCDFLLQQTLFWLTVGIAYALRNVREFQDVQRRATQTALEKSELENSLRRAELETMRMRLNPHFLFNCLQNISTLARREPETASRMLARLGDLLRYTIGKGAEPETSLTTEMNLTKAYASIEQMRFQDRLSVLFEVEPGVEDALVPTFVLQPLVENAIKHGLREEGRVGAIWVRGKREDEWLALTVSDNGTGITSANIANLEMGVGLDATSGRLERMYAGRHTFSIQRLKEGGTEVRIVIPLRWQSDAQETAREIATASDRR